MKVIVKRSMLVGGVHREAGEQIEVDDADSRIRYLLASGHIERAKAESAPKRKPAKKSA